MRLHHVISMLVLTGCAIDDLGSTESAVTRSSDIDDCPTRLCNSPIIDGHGFHELNAAGLPENDAGFRIVDFSKGGVHYGVSVKNGQLIGTGIKPLTHGDLTNAQFVIASTAMSYTITIKSVHTGVPYWTTKNGTFETYELTYVANNGNYDQPQWVCGALSMQYGDFVDLGPGIINPHETVFFENDRIDAKSRTLTIGGDPNWFNLGCAGTSLFKLHATGHTEAAGRALALAPTTTWQQRQTMLKMFAADYCGDGTAYTVPGQPLTYMDANGLNVYGGAMRKGIEARWDETGVRCLSIPRIDANPTKYSKPYFPEPPTALSYVIAACPAKVQICVGADTDFAGTSYIITSNL